jgi:hypothetical protein
MEFTRPFVGLSALLISTMATAMPPPVSVAPLVLSAHQDAKGRVELVELIEAMGKEGHFTLTAIAQDERVLDSCWQERAPKRACLATVAPTRVEAEPELTVVIDSPEWRQASFRVRCVGPDVARAREIELYLFDARSGRPNALQEKANLAGCMIGAIYSPPTERG